MTEIKTNNYAEGNNTFSGSRSDEVRGNWLNTSLYRADALRKKGDRTLLCGATASGKTTLLAALTTSAPVRKYLTMRQASGKGSVEPCLITVTNSDELDPDTLYYIAELKKVTKDDADDELCFLAAVLYAAAKTCVENNLNKDVYFDKLCRSFEYQLTSPANHSLEYKLKSSSMGNTNVLEEFKDIFDVIKSISPDEMISLYNLANAAATKKGQQKQRIFREKCLENAALKDDLDRFYNAVLDRLNRDAEKFGALLDKAGAEFVSTDQSDSADNTSYCGRKFGLAMKNGDTPNDVAELLLASESGSKETLLDDIALVFKGDGSLFDLDSDTDLLTVSVENGLNGEKKKIKNLNFIDTMGLFHKPSADIDEEASRSIDMMRQFKCSRMLMVVNADVTDTVKKHHEVISEILNSTNFRFDMHLMFTHYDKYLRSFAITKSDDIFAKPEVDWKECLVDAIEAKTDLVDGFNSITERRKASGKDNRKIPEIVAVYRAALLTNDGVGDALDEKKITYLNAITTFINTMLDRKLKQGKKLIVSRSELNKNVSVDNSMFFNKIGISNLYNELATVNNRNNRLYAQTVRAVNRHWQLYGDMFTSKVNPENSGNFTNFKSTFVQFIRDAAKAIGNDNIKIENGVCVNPDDDAEFENKVKGYLRDNVGRETAKIIAKDCYDKGFLTRTGFVYQYDRLYDELDYLIAHYFNAPTIVPGVELQDAISRSLKKCVDDYVDLYCIEQL